MIPTNEAHISTSEGVVYGKGIVRARLPILIFTSSRTLPCNHSSRYLCRPTRVHSAHRRQTFKLSVRAAVLFTLQPAARHHEARIRLSNRRHPSDSRVVSLTYSVASRADEQVQGSLATRCYLSSQPKCESDSHYFGTHHLLTLLLRYRKVMLLLQRILSIPRKLYISDTHK